MTPFPKWRNLQDEHVAQQLRQKGCQLTGAEVTELRTQALTKIRVALGDHPLSPDSDDPFLKALRLALALGGDRNAQISLWLEHASEAGIAAVVIVHDERDGEIYPLHAAEECDLALLISQATSRRQHVLEIFVREDPGRRLAASAQQRILSLTEGRPH